jgi:hypothetical protein
MVRATAELGQFLLAPAFDGESPKISDHTAMVQLRLLPAPSSAEPIFRRAIRYRGSSRHFAKSATFRNFVSFRTDKGTISAQNHALACGVGLAAAGAWPESGRPELPAAFT